MKPTVEEKRSLSIVLHNTLQYRETRNEVLDHILTAVEGRTNCVSFEREVDEVIKEDFGGYERLKQIEQEAFDSIRKATGVTFKKYLLQQILGFQIFLTIAVGLSIYQLSNSRSPGIHGIISSINLLVCCMPRFLNWYRNFRIGYIYKSTSRSIQDETFSSLSYMPISYWFWERVIYQFIDHTPDPIYFYTVYITFTFLINWILVFGYFKLYRDDFKVNILVN